MKSFVKRFVPFFLAFGIGLIVASFFVAISAPKFDFKRESKHKKFYRMKCENKRLRRENQRLKKELAEREFNEVEILNLHVPPPPMPPMPPMPPKESYASRGGR